MTDDNKQTSTFSENSDLRLRRQPPQFPHIQNFFSTRPQAGFSKSRWHSLGFQQGMTIEQAKARAKQLNAIAHLKRVEAQRLFLDKEKERLHLKFLAAVPELYEAQFEKKYIHDRQHGPKWRIRFHIS